ncbi:MAG: hypothetical protein U0169_12185 [Polyangiaceae bacterium]
MLAAVLALAVEREAPRMHGALPDTGESPRAEGVRRLARAFLRRAHDHGAIAMTPVAAQELSRRTDGGDEQSLGLFEAVWPAFALGLERRHRVPTTT